MLKATIRIPFEVIISDDVRFYGPSGEYVTFINEDEDCHFKRLINSEIDKQINAMKSSLEKDRNQPITINYKKEI